MGGWPHAGGLSVVRPSSTRTPSQSGSTPAVRQPSSPRTLVKSPSTSFLQSKMTAAVLTPPSSGLYREFDGMNTIPDPRTPSPGNVSRTGSNASEHHPDLSNEVATLSTKLINAINHQTNLDDSLQSARHELESAKKRIAQLEAANKEHETSMQHGLLVKAEDVRKREQGWKDELDEEKRLRAGAEKAKKAMELELENLTTALFEEANTMVASARKETEASERKNDQLKQQIQDMELLLASHQEQLQDLKVVMEKMSSDRADDNTNTHISSVPSTPGVAVHDRMSRMLDSVHAATGNEEVPPDHPLHFSHLIRPVLRTDLDGYEELKSVLTASRAPTTAPQSRAASGSFSGISLASLTGGPASSSHQNSPTSATNTSSSVIGSSPAKESLPPLKDTKLYKRALAEDINPTLLLESAPGLSWLARRTVPNALTNNSLLIEPLPLPKSRFYGPVFACALCGENRKADAYKRKHQFRTSDAEDAQRYPLCDYCLGRVRVCCDYVGFLRLVRDGLWRAETDDDIKGAWEEAVRLRERMFWARIGGGVVPAMAVARGEGARSPDAQRKSSVESVGPRQEKKSSVEDPFTGDKRASASIGSKTISRPGSRADTTTPIQMETVEQQAAHELVEAVKHNIEVTTEMTPEVAEPTIVEPAVKSDEPVDTAEGAMSPDNAASAFATPMEEQKQLGMPGAF